MISIPWQIVAAFIALFGLTQVLHYLKKVRCGELIETEKRIQHQFTMRVYRDGFLKGLNDGEAIKNGQRETNES